jgi:hypothetical protein
LFAPAALPLETLDGHARQYLISYLGNRDGHPDPPLRRRPHDPSRLVTRARPAAPRPDDVAAVTRARHAGASDPMTQWPALAPVMVAASPRTHGRSCARHGAAHPDTQRPSLAPTRRADDPAWAE